MFTRIEDALDAHLGENVIHAEQKFTGLQIANSRGRIVKLERQTAERRKRIAETLLALDRIDPPCDVELA